MPRVIIVFMLTFFCSFKILAYEWDFESLKTINDSCISAAIEDGDIGGSFEYCGCTTNNFSKFFTLDEVLSLYDSGLLETDRRYIKMINDCNKKTVY